MRNDKPRFSKCPWVDLAEIEEGNDQATLLALSFPSSISARSTQRHLLNLGLLQDRLELQDLPKTYSPISSGCLSFSRTVRSHSTCYGKAMKRTALNSDSGLGVTFQPKNGRFLGPRLGGMAKFASICPHVLLYDYVWVTEYGFKLDGALLELSSPRMVSRTDPSRCEKHGELSPKVIPGHTMIMRICNSTPESIMTLPSSHSSHIAC